MGFLERMLGNLMGGRWAANTAKPSSYATHSPATIRKLFYIQRITSGVTKRTTFICRNNCCRRLRPTRAWGSPQQAQLTTLKACCGLPVDVYLNLGFRT